MGTTVTSPIAIDKNVRLTHEGVEERALTTVLHLRMWNGRRLDRTTTQEVLVERKAEGDAGSFEKNLVPPKSLQPVTQAHSRARSAHYRLTLPWDENGVRIIAATALMEYTKVMDDERAKCEKAYRDFLNVYPNLMNDAPRRMGTRLFNPDDFPSVGELQRCFAFEMKLGAVPSKADFRVDLGHEMQARIQRDIESTVTERFAGAQRDLWERLLDTVKHFAKTMADDEKVFRNSTVEKLSDLAMLAPRLSLVPDPRLDEICKDILAITQGVEPSDFREDATLRRESAEDAEAVLARINESLKGAFL
jgi:hypothetical protein